MCMSGICEEYVLCCSVELVCFSFFLLCFSSTFFFLYTSLIRQVFRMYADR